MVDSIAVPDIRVIRTAWNVLAAPSRVADTIVFNDEASLNRAWRFGGICLFFLMPIAVIQPNLAQDASKWEKLIIPYSGIISLLLVTLLMFPLLFLTIGKRVQGNRLTFGNYIHVAAYTLIFHLLDAIGSAISRFITEARETTFQSVLSVALMIWAMVFLARMLAAKTEAGYLRIGVGMAPVVALVLYAIAQPASG
ncbi:MAG: hypothetical protein ACLPPF_21315 [Rhodomicrobium sp.]